MIIFKCSFFHYSNIPSSLFCMVLVYNMYTILRTGSLLSGKLLFCATHLRQCRTLALASHFFLSNISSNQHVSVLSSQFFPAPKFLSVKIKCVGLFFLQPIRSPLAPNVLITGIVPSESSIFKSALHPLRLTFRTANGGSCKIIFKKGDDLRQDQLVAIKHILSLLVTKFF